MKSASMYGVLQIAVVLGLLPVGQGCAAHLISDYDPYLDQHAADRIDAFISKMEASSGKPEGTYANNAAFYADASAELGTLKARAQTAEKSELVVKSLDLIAADVQRLAEVHKKGGDAGLPVLIGDSARVPFQVQFESFYKLEAALRRGQ
ncbi:MAG: hypothetical protein JST54_35700 [Deltaproteobacteria bacterium]|nr:hypothetical protein [Deltaproteobacteria bacterium]